MEGFPKAIGTGQDLFHCLAMVQAGQLRAEDLKSAIGGIEAQEYISCPIQAISEDRKTVTVNYCAEAKVSQTVNGMQDCAITAVENQKTGTDVSSSAENIPNQTVVIISAALGTDETSLRIPAPTSPLAALGITQDQLNSIKGVLKQYE